jgi:MFS family permease
LLSLDTCFNHSTKIRRQHLLQPCLEADEHGMNIRTFARITLPLACVTALTQAARTVMSTIGPALAVEYSLTAAQLGAFSAALFASYCLAQLPAGVALDRWGPRHVQAVLCAVAAMGFALCALSEGPTMFLAARLITGIGISTGLIGLLKGNSQWFDRHDVARATGFGMVIGTIGSFLTTAPAQAALPAIGWRGIMWCCAAAALLIAIWNLLSVRDREARLPPRSLRAEFSELAGILTAAPFLRFAPIAALLTVLNFTYLGLWAGPWLRDVGHFGGRERAAFLLLYTVGLFVGGPLTGTLVSIAQRKNYHSMAVPMLCTIGLMVVQILLAVQPHSTPEIAALWLLFAVLSACGPAAYAAVGSAFSPARAGRVSTAVNTLTLAMVFIMQIVIGRLVGAWPTLPNGDWSPNGYSFGLLVTIALQAAALIWAWMSLKPAVWRR